MIYWSAFSWEAFATLATGLAAVWAAWRIGRKQIEIQKNQSEIQAQSIRSDLFAKRFENYETVRDFMQSVLGKPDEIDEYFQSRFFTAKREARFLFGTKVHDSLDEIWGLCSELNILSSDRQQWTNGGDISWQNLNENYRITFRKTSERYSSLHEVYSEMSLDSLTGRVP